MKILFLGYSSIVRRRILPVIGNVRGITAVALASHSRYDEIAFPAGVDGTAYSNYEAALNQSGADLVYVSTVNGDHARWAEAALQRGLHTIVDKPAFLSVADSERMVALARAQNCCLAESTVYAYHPQIETIRQLFAEKDDTPTRITATFSFPPLPASNFRYRRAPGGGALWDLGPYAMTPGRLFFGAEPERVTGWVNGQATEVETSFSVLAHYGNGRSLAGHFGFDTAYRNHLEVLGAKTAVWADRIFTTPDSMENSLHVNQNNERRVVKAAAVSPFACFLAAVVTAVDMQAYESFAADLLADARTMARLRKIVLGEI